jgi:flagellar basal body-associated protein FliL
MDSFENLDLSKLKKKNVNETIKILILIYILITFYLVSIIIYIYIFMQTAFVHAVDGRNTERHVPHLRHMLCLCLELLFSAEKH